jgi:hypothetical protein
MPGRESLEGGGSVQLPRQRVTLVYITLDIVLDGTLVTYKPPKFAFFIVKVTDFLLLLVV